MTQPRRYNPHPVLSPHYCPVHEIWERLECGLARTEEGRELVEERERRRLRELPVKAEERRPSPTLEQQYPSRETERLRQENAALQAEIKRLKTPPPLEPTKGLDL